MHIACAKWNPYVKNITKDLIYISKWPKSNNKCYICNKTIGYINKCDHSSKSTRCNKYNYLIIIIFFFFFFFKKKKKKKFLIFKN